MRVPSYTCRRKLPEQICRHANVIRVLVRLRDASGKPHDMYVWLKNIPTCTDSEIADQIAMFYEVMNYSSKASETDLTADQVTDLKAVVPPGCGPLIECVGALHLRALFMRARPPRAPSQVLDREARVAQSLR